MPASHRYLPNKPWTPEEKDMLRRLADACLPRQEICDQLQRSASAVSHQAAKISVELQPPPAAKTSAPRLIVGRYSKPGPATYVGRPNADAADPAFHLKVVRLSRPSLPWVWKVHREGESEPRERSVRGYRCAEDAWDAGKAPLARFKHHGSRER